MTRVLYSENESWLRHLIWEAFLQRHIGRRSSSQEYQSGSQTYRAADLALVDHWWVDDEAFEGSMEVFLDGKSFIEFGYHGFTLHPYLNDTTRCLTTGTLKYPYRGTKRNWCSRPNHRSKPDPNVRIFYRIRADRDVPKGQVGHKSLLLPEGRTIAIHDSLLVKDGKSAGILVHEMHLSGQVLMYGDELDELISRLRT